MLCLIVLKVGSGQHFAPLDTSYSSPNASAPRPTTVTKGFSMIFFCFLPSHSFAGAHSVFGVIVMSFLTLCGLILLQNKEFYYGEWRYSLKAVDQLLVLTFVFSVVCVFCGIADINGWWGWYPIFGGYVGLVTIVYVGLHLINFKRRKISNI